MKENKAPEKIYIDDPTGEFDDHWSIYKNNDSIEYTRTDAFIKVNLEKEIQQHINDCLDIKFPTTDIKLIAKDVEYTARKFFELGMKSKGE